MISKTLTAALLALPAATVPAHASAASARTLVVRETAGIRRGNFPAQASVQLEQGALNETGRVRLLLAQQEIPVQASESARWPDGSIRRLDLYFNASIGALAELRYRLEIGEPASAQPASPERLTVVEFVDALQIGKVRLGRPPAALLQSVAFGHEIVGSGLNGFSVESVDGNDYLLSAGSLEVLQPGPLFVEVRYRGTAALSPEYSVPFTVDVAMPNGKSWVRYRAEVDDPARRVRALELHSSFALGAQPWTWDFGTGSWSYGAFRSPAESAVLKQVIGVAHAADWQISTGLAGQEQVYERAAGRRPSRVEGWGHLQDASRAIAFAVEEFGAVAGEYSIALDGQGQLVFRRAAAKPASRHSLGVYQHYVASPVPIGAATSPVAMASPLVVTVER